MPNTNNERQVPLSEKPNRYAHIGTGRSQPATAAAAAAATTTTTTTTTATVNSNLGTQSVITRPAPSNNKVPLHYQQQQQQQHHHHQQQQQQYPSPNGNVYQAGDFQTVDWRAQFHELRSKLMDKVHEPQSQRRIILVIVCCALLLDNMLYMVIVPIIPDYLRSTGAWETYAEGAHYVRRNLTSGAYRWERVGGTVVYEGEESAVGFLFASKAMVQLLVNPFSGHIIDRIGYEIPMMIGLVVMFFSTIVFACGRTYSILFLARSLQGVGSAFADTSGLAMIADRFTEESERQRALGIALAFISFGSLVAPPFGAVLYQTAGKEVPFILLSLVCLIDAVLLLLVTQPGTLSLMSLSNLLSAKGPPGKNDYESHSAGTTTTTRKATTASMAKQTPNRAATVDVVDRRRSITTSMSTDDGSQKIELEEGNAKRIGSAGSGSGGKKLQRQKSMSRRQSLTASGAPVEGTPIYVLLKDPYIACCAGALVMANVSLAFLEPTISIWMQDTMQDIEEWQIGVVWLPAFVPHVAGVYCTIKLADKYPKYQWLIAAIGLALEGLSSFLVPFCSSFWSLIIPISGICFGIALVDTAILPTLGYLVDTRYVSVYGSIYAIADISYSLSYTVGPIIAGGIVEAIGFTALNVLIAVTNLGYCPVLIMLKHIHDYKPFTVNGNDTNDNDLESQASSSSITADGGGPLSASQSVANPATIGPGQNQRPKQAQQVKIVEDPSQRHSVLKSKRHAGATGIHTEAVP